MYEYVKMSCSFYSGACS